MSRKKRISDPVTLDEDAELSRRRPCSWIENPYAHRCPRWRRTGEACWCRCHDTRIDRDWPWRVVPPLKAEGGEP